MTSRRSVLSLFAILAAVGVIGTACGDGGGDVAAPAATAPGPPERAQFREDEAGAGRSGGAGEIVPLSEVGAAVGPRIVKSASISLELERRMFDARLQDVVDVAGRHGGFVATSRTSGGEHSSSTLVLRVPADQFEAVLGEVRRLGTITAQEVSGHDVTAEFIDLEARLRNWEAQEDVLLGLMAKSTTIEESIEVQRALQDVQLSIERIRGQLRVLTDQSDFSTITVNLAEAGAPAPEPQGAVSKAWEQAVQGALAVVSAVVVTLGYLFPVALLVLVAALVWMAITRRTKVRADAAA